MWGNKLRNTTYETNIVKHHIKPKHSQQNIGKPPQETTHMKNKHMKKTQEKQVKKKKENNTGKHIWNMHMHKNIEKQQRKHTQETNI